jgi:FAD/FMN-containing dehydrogenase
MDLIEPGSKEEIREALRAATERGTRVSIVGGRTHAYKGDPCEVDMELATSRLDRVVDAAILDLVATSLLGAP